MKTLRAAENLVALYNSDRSFLGNMPDGFEENVIAKLPLAPFVALALTDSKRLKQAENLGLAERLKEGIEQVNKLGLLFVSSSDTCTVKYKGQTIKITYDRESMLNTFKHHYDIFAKYLGIYQDIPHEKNELSTSIVILLIFYETMLDRRSGLSFQEIKDNLLPIPEDKDLNVAFDRLSRSKKLMKFTRTDDRTEYLSLISETVKDLPQNNVNRSSEPALINKRIYNIITPKTRTINKLDLAEDVIQGLKYEKIGTRGTNIGSKKQAPWQDKLFYRARLRGRMGAPEMKPDKLATKSEEYQKIYKAGYVEGYQQTTDEQKYILREQELNKHKANDEKKGIHRNPIVMNSLPQELKVSEVSKQTSSSQDVIIIEEVNEQPIITEQNAGSIKRNNAIPACMRVNEEQEDLSMDVIKNVEPINYSTNNFKVVRYSASQKQNVTELYIPVSRRNDTDDAFAIKLICAYQSGNQKALETISAAKIAIVNADDEKFNQAIGNIQSFTEESFSPTPADIYVTPYEQKPDNSLSPLPVKGNPQARLKFSIVKKDGLWCYLSRV